MPNPRIVNIVVSTRVKILDASFVFEVAYSRYRKGVFVKRVQSSYTLGQTTPFGKKVTRALESATEKKIIGAFDKNTFVFYDEENWNGVKTSQLPPDLRGMIVGHIQTLREKYHVK